MKINKYLLAFVLILTGLLLIQERTQYYLDNADADYSYIDISSIDASARSDVIKYLENNKKSDIGIWCGEQKNLKNGSTVVIYCDNNAKTVLRKKSGIKAQTYRSLFSGKKTYSIKSIRADRGYKNIWCVYFTGSNSDVSALVGKTNKNFGTEFKFNAANGHNNIHVIASIIWSIVFSLILLVDYYSLLISRKERFIRMTYGEKSSRIIIKELITDIAVYFSEFAILSYLSYLIYNSYICFYISLICFAVFAVLDAVINISFTDMSAKKSLSDMSAPKHILKTAYTIKFFSGIMTAVLICESLSAISFGVFLIKEKHTYEKLKSYSFIDIQPKNTFTDDSVFNILDNIKSAEKDIYSSGKSPMVLYSGENLGSGTDFIWINSNEKSQINKLLPSDNTSDLWLVPIKLKNNSDLRYKIKLFEKNGNINASIVYYSKSVRINNISSDFSSAGIHKDPVILYTPGEKTVPLDLFSGVFTNIIFKIDSYDDISGILNKYGFDNNDVQVMNAYTQFMKYYEQNKYKLILSCIILAVTLLFNFFVTNTLLTIEFQFKAKERSLKRLFGYDLISRNKNIIISIFADTVFSAIVTTILALSGTLYSPVFSVSAGLFIYLITEVLNTGYHISKFEKAETQNILKGCLV